MYNDCHCVNVTEHIRTLHNFLLSKVIPRVLSLRIRSSCLYAEKGEEEVKKMIKCCLSMAEIHAQSESHLKREEKKTENGYLVSFIDLSFSMGRFFFYLFKHSFHTDISPRVSN